MPRNTIPNLAQSVKDVRETATFFDRLADEASESDLHSGRDLMSVARKRGLRIPKVLEGSRITYNPHYKSGAKADLRQAIIVQLPLKPATPEMLKRTLGPYCVTVTKTTAGVTVTADVCISCSFSFPKSAKCTITITATVEV